MIVEGDDAFNGGYNKALRDIVSLMREDQWGKTISINGVTFSEHFAQQIEPLILPQRVNP
jgi:hypothetical protein